MALDRQLSRDFWLHEFPGWERATERQVARLEETVARVLQPIRTTFDVAVFPSSWLWWSSGDPRTGAHAADGDATAGTVDFVVDAGLTTDVFEWGSQHLTPSGYIGRWIYEPERSAAEGRRQGEHIHMAPREAMVEAFADSRIQVLEERAEGEYFLHFELEPVAWGALVAVAAAVAGYIILARRSPSFAL